MIKQTTVVVENTPGRLYEVLKTLSNAEINLNGISIADSTDYGMFRLILSDPVKGQQVLREAGFIVQSTDVLCLSVKDEIGSLQKGLACLAKEQINIQYTYAFGLKAAGKALIIAKTDVPAETLPVFGVTLFVAAIPVCASPSGGQNGTPA